jgi:hypothetical protein
VVGVGGEEKTEERVADPGNSTRAEGSMGYPTCRRNGPPLLRARGTVWIALDRPVHRHVLSLSVCLVVGLIGMGWIIPVFVEDDPVLR